MKGRRSVRRGRHHEITPRNGNERTDRDKKVGGERLGSPGSIVCGQLSDGESRIFGVMIESNLVEGNQSITEPDAMTYGCSVTDACISWEDSDSCLRELAAASENRMLAS